MISFRHHVVSLVAVMLALAVGVVLGGGPLAAVGQDLTQQEKPADAEPEMEAGSAYADTLAASVATRAYGDKLRGVPVSVLTMPGADDDSVAGLLQQLDAAEAKLAGMWRIEDTLMSPAEKTLVDTLGSQLATQQESSGVAADATTYDRMGQLIGRAISSEEIEGKPVDNAAATITESLDVGELLAADEEPTSRGAYVVVVLGPDSAVEEDPIVAGLLHGLSSQSAGVVVTASTEDGARGRMSRLRDDEVSGDVTTVDGVETTAGAVTAVLALTRMPDTLGGDFGPGGTDGAVPLG